MDNPELAKSYEFPNCPITISLQIFPEDGSPEGRQILIGIRNHQDPPIFKSHRSNDLACIQQLIDELLAQLQAELPARLVAAIEREQTKALPKEDKSAEKPNTKSAKLKPKLLLPNIEVQPQPVETSGAEQTTLNLFED
ncbi:MAG: hypothetical protein RMY36_030740 [Nostoc sp. SerVER01]|nr:hypothetical protein [Nostoc sp. SerVER01]